MLNVWKHIEMAVLKNVEKCWKCLNVWKHIKHVIRNVENVGKHVKCLKTCEKSCYFKMLKNVGKRVTCLKNILKMLFL